MRGERREGVCMSVRPAQAYGFVAQACGVAVIPLLSAGLLAGCGASLHPPPEVLPPIVLAPPAPPAVPVAVSQALKHDTAAVQRRARQFLAPPSTSAEAVASLEPLTRNVNRALAVMELHHRREGRYRRADVVAARAAADAVAQFLDASKPSEGPMP